MITLTVIGVVILAILIAIVSLVGGVVVVFLDPIIAILIIWLVGKIIKMVKEKLNNN